MAGSMTPNEIRKELERLHHSAFGWAMVCCGRDRDLAAEVLQQAYCRILAGDAVFTGNSMFSTWFFGVIRMMSLEEHRRRKRQQNVLPIEDAAFGNKANCKKDSIGVPIEQRELADQLSAALQKLSERQREILHLTFYENMTIEAASNVLGITVGSARQHYHRGKVALARTLVENRELER